MAFLFFFFSSFFFSSPKLYNLIKPDFDLFCRVSHFDLFCAVVSFDGCIPPVLLPAGLTNILCVRRSEAGRLTPPNAFALCSRSVGSSELPLAAGCFCSAPPPCLALASSSLFFLASSHAGDLVKKDSRLTTERGLWVSGDGVFWFVPAAGLVTVVGLVTAFGCFLSSSVHGGRTGLSAVPGTFAGGVFSNLAVLPTCVVGPSGGFFTNRPSG